jgi:hypothetical protein
MKELKDIPKENPFRVPDGYFEDLADRITSATSVIAPVEGKKTIAWRLKPYLAVAASVTLLAVIGYAAFHIFSSKGRNQVQMELTLNEININYINDIDLQTLEEKVAASAPFDIMPDVSSDEIIDYLISENINILDIYEQL